MPVDQVTTLLSRTATKNTTMHLMEKGKLLDETEMRQIMEEYGKVKKVRIKRDRYGYQQQRAMISQLLWLEMALFNKKALHIIEKHS